MVMAAVPAARFCKLIESFDGGREICDSVEPTLRLAGHGEAEVAPQVCICRRSVVPLPARRFRLAAATGVFALTAALALTSLPAQAEPPRPGADPAVAVPGRYIVTLKGAPITTYGGEVKGLKATRPTTGRKVNARSSSAKRYRSYLERQQDRTAGRVGAKADKHYAVALNGFAASLTSAQARALQRSPAVLSVVKDTPRRLLDDRSSVDFLRLRGLGGAWQSLGGKGKAGAGVVVGVLDTGYWPESTSFAGAPLGTAAPTAADPYRPYRVGAQIRMNKSDGSTFTGTCQAGENPAADFEGTECNSKVISARYFNATYKQAVEVADRNDFASPRDRDGHGSHTASTAAGNADRPVSISGRSFGKISGVAPAAKLAVYKMCWTSDPDPDGSCYIGDSLDAIDQAVLDGVDVINYSVSGSDSLNDPVDQAFRSAAAAGIFVATLAGNGGPGPSTVDHVAPWVTTAAASTVAPYAGTVVLGNGAKYVGISTTVSASVGPASLVAAARVRRVGASAGSSSACVAGTLDPAKVAGKIVVCEQGVNARVAKSREVDRAGGSGMVLVDTSGNSSDRDFHAVPTVHLHAPGSLTVRSYALSTRAKATLKKGNLTSTPIAYPQVAGFSSRGPSVGVAGDLLKPDISAPGVAVLAAVSPVTASGKNFDFSTGTSMSAPHIAGAAALYFGEQPKWSPMAVKSAMMTTTARVKKKDGSLSRDYYAQGAGNIRPRQMLDPGLIFDSGPAEWESFMEGAGFDLGPEVDPVDPSDYNSPSIAIGRLAGTQTVTRKVTAVKPGKYKATVGVDGVDATVTPSLLSFTRPGQTRTIQVTMSRRSAAIGRVAFGSLALESKSVTVRVPIAVTPQRVNAPTVVRGTGTSGSLNYLVRPGFSGSFASTASGLDAAEVQQGEVTDNDLDAVDEYTTNVPAHTRVARFTSQSDKPDADIDMAVYGPSGELVAISTTSTGSESVTLFDPAEGQYQVLVAPFADPPDLSSSTYRYRAFAVGPDLPNFSVSPAIRSVVNGVPFVLNASWTGLDPAVPYLGYVQYLDGTGTMVEINPA
jgi:hypothetical protein